MSDDLGSSEDDDTRLYPHLEYFSDRLNLVFSIFFCHLEFSNDEDLDDSTQNDRTWALRTIYNACLHTTLISLRDLDDFLTPRSKSTKPDDLRASDFGFEGSLSFLAKQERERINKLIAHTTTLGAANTKARWDVFELTCKAVSQASEFLKWIESHYTFSHFYMYTSAVSCRTKTHSILEYIKAQRGKAK